MFRFSQDKDEKSLLKSNELFRKAISLLYQNKDSSINETTIQNLIGLNYLNSGQLVEAMRDSLQVRICNVSKMRNACFT